MSVPFTSTATKDLQSLTLYNELQTAYSERRQALGQTAQSNYAEDAYIQKLSMWTAWQNWINTYCTGFYNYDESGPIVNATTGTEAFTLATFRAKAGLNANGFTRHYRIDRETAGTAYGVAQVDDYVGPWLIDELQAAFSVLRYSRIATSLTCELKGVTEYGDVADGDSWENAYISAKAAADAAYATATPEAFGGIALTARALPSSFALFTLYPVQSTAGRGSTAWQISDNLGARGALLDEAYLVLKGEKPLRIAYESLELTYDDGDHNVAEGWAINETVSAGAAPNYPVTSTARSHYEVPWPAAYPYFTFVADPAPPPYVMDEAYESANGYAVYERYWVLKWNFTNI